MIHIRKSNANVTERVVGWKVLDPELLITVHVKASSRGRARMIAARAREDAGFGTVAEALLILKPRRAYDYDGAPVLDGHAEGLVPAFWNPRATLAPKAE